MKARSHKINTSLIVLALGLTSFFISVSSFADHVGIGTGNARPQLKLIIGPATSPDTFPAAVTVDLSATPNLVGMGPIAAVPNILIEVGFRAANVPWTTVVLTATAPAGLNFAAQSIPISDFSWTVGAPTAAPGAYNVTLPPGAFVPGSQVVGSMTVRKNKKAWMGGELTFTFANVGIYGEGTYIGTVTYTAASL